MGLVKNLQLHEFERVRKESKINMPFYNCKSHQNPTTYYILIIIFF